MLPTSKTMEYPSPTVMALNISNETDPSNDRDSLNILVPLSIVYSIIFIAGVLGNTSTCIVISRNRSMHTATNFYLFSLAVSDLILLVCGLPLELHSLWYPNRYPLGEAPCIIFSLASETTTNATVLTITAFTVERYIAICRPFMSHTMSKLSRAVRFIVAIWICALLTAAPQAMQFGVMTFIQNDNSVTVCTIKGAGVHQAFVISSFIFFVVPMSVITVLYVLIGVKLRKSRILHPPKKPSVESNGKSSGSNRYKSSSSQRRVIRMLVVVALSFFVCWAPFHLQRLLAIYGKSLKHPSKLFYSVYIVFTYLSGTLYYLSTAINPFLYNIMSNKFRNAFKVTLAACCRKKSSSRLGRTYSTLMSHRQRAATLAAERAFDPRRLVRRSTGSSQLFNVATQVSANKESRPKLAKLQLPTATPGDGTGESKPTSPQTPLVHLGASPTQASEKWTRNSLEKSSPPLCTKSTVILAALPETRRFDLLIGSDMTLTTRSPQLSL